MNLQTLTCLPLALTLGAAHAQGQDRDPQPPNIVFILMDDLGYGDLGCYGQRHILTPNIDSLARLGVRLTQHYSGSPVSAPARCVLLTGMHAGHCQIRGNDEMAWRGDVNSHAAMLADSTLEGQAPLREGTMTLARMLKQAGYTTGCFGKWGLGAPGTEGEPLRQGFDRFFGYNCQRMAHNHYPPFLYDDSCRVMLDNPLVDPHRVSVPSDADPRDQANYAVCRGRVYAHDEIFSRLTDWVDSCAAQAPEEARPMFLFWATPLPHVSLQAPKEWVDRYVALFGDEEPRPQGGYLPCRYPRATYAAMVSYFDHQVGQLVQQLRRLGMWDNTVLILASDNGPTFNGGSDSPWFDSARPFRSDMGRGKCFVYEGGIRVPAIAVWPGRIPAGTVTDMMSGFQDMMPTLAAIAGADCPGQTDGLDITPALTGHPYSQPQHPWLYWEYPHPTDHQKALRRGRWKAVVHHHDDPSRRTAELYDLATDPVEAHDLAAALPDTLRAMESIMDQAHTDTAPRP